MLTGGRPPYFHRALYMGPGEHRRRHLAAALRQSIDVMDGPPLIAAIYNRKNILRMLPSERDVIDAYAARITIPGYRELPTRGSAAHVGLFEHVGIASRRGDTYLGVFIQRTPTQMVTSNG